MPDELHAHLALALVPGLGPKLTAALLERFGSPSAARRATAAELLEIPHIGAKLAETLATALHTTVYSRMRLQPTIQASSSPSTTYVYVYALPATGISVDSSV